MTSRRHFLALSLIVLALLASSRVAACQGSPQPGRAAAGYDLARDERRGGHTLERHVGRTDAELRERLRREPGIRAASTYTDRDTAERVVAATLSRERTRVERWSRGTGRRPNLALDYRGDAGASIGRTLGRRDRRSRVCRDAVVVLRWDDRRGDFYVLTSYPEAR